MYMYIYTFKNIFPDSKVVCNPFHKINTYWSSLASQTYFRERMRAKKGEGEEGL